MSLLQEQEVQHLSIEAQGRQWASRYFERAGGDLSRVVLVISPKHAERMLLPALVEGSGIRLHEQGLLYTGYWKPKTIREEDNRRFLHNPTSIEYQLLYPKEAKVGSANDYLQHIPFNRDHVKALTFEKADSIEAAIRRQQDILNDFVGPESAETIQAERVIACTDGLVEKVLQGPPLTLDALQKLAGQTDSFLEEVGLVNPQAPRKVRMMAMLEKVPHLDSLGRINETVMRTRIRAAYLQAIRQQVLTGLVAEKFSKNLIQLEFERELNRWALEKTVVSLQRRVLWHVGFESHRDQTETQRKVLKVIITEVAHRLLSVPRVRPYLPVARIAAIDLVGCRPEKQDLNRRIIGNDQLVDELFELTPVTELVAANRFEEADKRVEEVRALIDNVLQ